MELKSDKSIYGIAVASIKRSISLNYTIYDYRCHTFYCITILGSMNIGSILKSPPLLGLSLKALTPVGSIQK